MHFAHKLLFLLCGFVLIMPKAQAHQMRTGYLQLHERSTGRVFVRWHSTISQSSLRWLLPPSCKQLTADVQRRSNTWSGVYQCRKSLAGEHIKVSGLGILISEVIVQVTFSDGASVSRLLRTGNATWRLPGRRPPAQLIRDYLKLGFWHILGAWDHMLFLLGLLVLVRSTKLLLWSATLFTLAHSLTLACSILEIFRASPEATEACIALSLILCARERLQRDDEQVQAHQALGMGFFFGLVHGLGFAGVLADIGLPQGAIPMSLLGFNLGVELAQITFLSLGLILFLWLRSKGWQKSFELFAAYIVGIAGTSLLLQRLWSWL